MKFACLASGSSANCYLLEMGAYRFLIEAGLPIKEIRNKLKMPLTDINACFVTHSHQDHLRSAENLSLYMPIICSEKTTDLIGKNFMKFNPGETILYTGIKVITFEVEHDCLGSAGFIFQNEQETFLFVNDCKFVKYDLSKFKFDYIAFECNYVTDILESDKSGHPTLTKRKYNSHMSLEVLIKTLKTYDLSNCKAIYLMHLSDAHSHEERMKTEVQKATGVPAHVCLKNGGIN